MGSVKGNMNRKELFEGLRNKVAIGNYRMRKVEVLQK